MSDFLLELRCEEIPARMQKGARADLEKLFRQQMEEAGITPGAITVWSTPRRLALIAADLPEQTAAVSEEAKGPPEGAPDQAVEGFCRKNGITRDQLEIRDIKGRPTYFAVKNIPGRAVKDVLAEAIPAIIRAFPWPKSMRWGAASLRPESLRWVRPLSGIVAILGEELVECEIDGIATGFTTLGHRFHHPDAVTIGGAGDYAEKLRACHVIVDHTEREAIVREGAAKAASEAGLSLVEDEGLVVENAGLTEWPVPLLGRFDEAFLEVPPEVIQLTARTNQKYFVCEKDGKLANAFVCTANIDAKDGGAAIVDGNRKVLAARLSDARFFWDVDRKVPLEDQARKLTRITFHEKLGTVADKVERVAGLASSIVDHCLQSKAGLKEHQGDNAIRAAQLAKADLVTEMVGEFPELQGLMGSYYAERQGEAPEVVSAIREQYLPQGQGGQVPTEYASIALNLADKMDTITAFFMAGMPPTGSSDPFALRRAALGAIRIITENGIRQPLSGLIHHSATSLTCQRTGRQDIDDLAWHEMEEAGFLSLDNLKREVVDFFADRLKVQQREAGVRHDLIDAVFALGGEDDLVRLLARVHALQAFVETEDGANLLAGYKRAANILKKEDWQGIESEIPQTGEEDPLSEVDDPELRAVVEAKLAERHSRELSYTPEPAEKALMDALDAAEPRAAAAIEAEDFEAAMTALAALRQPIDAFFDEVTVNVSDTDKRAARLDLLARFRAAVHQVADFSKIEG